MSVPPAPKWTPTARERLKQIVNESRHRFGADQSRRYRSRFRTAIRNIQQFPELGQERPDIGPGLRSIPVAPFVVVDEIVGERIWILAIVHQHEDVGTIAEEN